MNYTFIDISDIFRKQSRIIGSEPSNKWIFYWIPVLCGMAASLLFYNDTKAVVDVLTLFISIFIPIFMSLLATMISFVMNKIVTRHNKERIPLIKETFYNICYLIPVSLVLLVLSLLMNLTIGKYCMVTDTLSLHKLIILAVGVFFYGGVTHIVLNLLMITKRIFKLFDKEIDLLTGNMANEAKTTGDIGGNKAEPTIRDVNAAEGEE